MEQNVSADWLSHGCQTVALRLPKTFQEDPPLARLQLLVAAWLKAHIVNEAHSFDGYSREAPPPVLLDVIDRKAAND